MKRVWLLLALIALGCDDQPNDPPRDGAVADRAVVDVGGMLDAGPDRALPPPDAGRDAIVDARADAIVDAMVDAAVDAIVDATVDAAVDATVDAIVDAAVDATADAIVDATVDAAPDMAVVPVDQGPDAAEDMAPPEDMAVDAAEDMAPPEDMAVDAAEDMTPPEDMAVDAAEDQFVPPVPDAGDGDLTLEILAPLDGALVQQTPIRVEGAVTAGALVTVNGLAAPVVDGAFAIDVPLDPGPNPIVAEATVGEQQAEARITVTYEVDVRAPVVRITAPADGQTILRRTIDVVGIVDDPTATVRVGAIDAEVTDGTWIARDVRLAEGENVIEATATDPAGNVGRTSIRVTVDSLPADIVITEPEDETFTGEATITVRGRVVGDDVERVEVDGVEVPVAPDGTWVREAVPLDDGRTVISAVAVDTAGNVGLARVAVIRDGTPPTIHIETPAPGAVLTTSQIDVAGVSNDFITGITVGDDDLRVWVNGQPALVQNRTWTLANLLLQPGPNTITVVAEDRAGNRNSRSIEVTVADRAGQRLVLISGQSQGARQGEPLRDPLVVSLLDANGNPVPAQPVTFEVVRGDGELEAFPEAGRSLTVNTDDNGLAGVTFVPGGRAGAGSHRVIARAAGFVGEVEFCTSVMPSAGAMVAAVTGENQTGQTERSLPEPFVALVTDDAGNPVEGTEVTFTVVEGDASFGGVPEYTVASDGDGLARATLDLGSTPGVVTVTATIDAIEDPEEDAPGFRATAVDAGARALTRIVGRILDDADQPLPGVTAWVRLEDGPILSGQADENGDFVIEGVPVGAVHLVIEGGTADLDGEWPRLTYDLMTVAGVDNGLGGPIHLPEIDPGSRAVVGGDRDVTLRLAGIEGAELTVFADSVTCLDGTDECAISWSQVRGERVPDPAPMGSTFDIVATLQPPGIRFDPPARLCIPNRGNPPGFQIEMFAYDHDLGDWVGLGTGTVTPDGTRLCSDDGFGLHKSGWHGAPPPPPPNRCASSCKTDNPCMTASCRGRRCVRRPKGNGTQCDDGSGCSEKVCQGGSCVTQSQQQNGSPCPSNNNQCIENPVCQDGACVGDDKDCDGDNPCINYGCDPNTGCTETPKDEGSTCDPPGGPDPNRCIEKYTCQGGNCAPKEKECPPTDNPCAENRCQPNPRHRPGRSPATTCREMPINEGQECGDPDGECGAYTCRDGTCEPDADSTEGDDCDDDDECTEEDRCQQGQCKGDKITIAKRQVTANSIEFPLERIKDPIENGLRRIIPLQIKFRGGALNVSGSVEDCCTQEEYIEDGKTGASTGLSMSAGIKGSPPAPYSGFGEDEESYLGVSYSYSYEWGLIFDASLTLGGSMGKDYDECTDKDCTTIDGNLSLAGAARLTANARGCVETFGGRVNVCRGFGITPGQLSLSITGGGKWTSANCPPPTGLDFYCKLGELKFSASVDLGPISASVEFTILEGIDIL